MTALTQATGTAPRAIRYQQFVLANAVVAWPGAAMFWDPVNAVATIGSATPGLVYLGRCAEDVASVTGSTALGVKVNVDLDIEILTNAFQNSTGLDTVLATDFLKPCYALDDQTVSRLPLNKCPIGVIWGVSAAKGTVDVAKFAAVPAQATLNESNLPAFAANAIVLASVVSGTHYDVPATSGISTITLPAAAPDGTIVYFRANGTANANTVQYLDATGAVALTTALTASKRHQVTAIKLGTIWTAFATVSP